MYVVAGVLISGVFAGPSVALAQENGVDASLLSEVTESPNEGTVEAETEAPKPVADDDTSAANVDAPANGASEESPESAPQAAAPEEVAEPQAAQREETAAAGPADAPKTGFELRGEVDGETWTTEEEELAFLNTLADTTDRVEFDVLGKSTLGRDLHLVRVGAEPAARADLNEANTAMVTCTQHGNEEAPREACLKLMRRSRVHRGSRDGEVPRGGHRGAHPDRQPRRLLRRRC